MTISPEEFVKAWQSSKSIAEIIRKTGMSKNAVFRRAHYYRQKGVPLKKFGVGQRGNDWQKLVKLAEESRSDE